ncbi:response regulator [Bradyrhizobium liaoningense]|uniref:response regulator n=1 Tax=Bradyrhizobium liaoningense TaxID=43992 RepID=UPI001BADA918|nr:response regulator [Bradyrhizobium liaoningense]MBR0905538.1 response regulator [Bradyrhizobium liaoningense]
MAQPPSPKIVVLVVEDEWLIRINAADMIRELGYIAIEAHDADHAITLLERMPEISVVFTDIQMPGSLDGIRLAAVIRDRWSSIKLLITSGQVRPMAADLPPGARFLNKPYVLRQLDAELTALAAA